MVRLSRIVERLGGELIQRAQDGWAGDPDIVDVELDSRIVEAGALFCALTGSATTGAASCVRPWAAARRRSCAEAWTTWPS